MRNLMIVILIISVMSGCASTQKKESAVKKSSNLEWIIVTKTEIPQRYEVIGKIGFITMTSQDSANQKSVQPADLEQKVRQEAYDKYGDDADAVIEVQYSQVTLSGRSGTRVSGTVVRIIRDEKK